MTLSNASNATISDATGTLTITDDETAPTVTLATSATSIAENSGSNLTLTATLSGTTDAAITVALDTSGSATEGTDYTDGSGNLDDIVISAGATTGTVTFDPTDDSIYEGDETATIAINGVTGKTGVAENSTPQSVTITISENESSPTVTLTSSASSIAENSGSTITLTATISQVADEDVTVNLGAAGTSTNGTDYGYLSSITVSAGDTTGTATFDPTDDSVYEGNETAVISISSVSGADAAESGSQSEPLQLQKMIVHLQLLLQLQHQVLQKTLDHL